ncbi:cation-translocating P-type ATPase [uncultured Piscinibacter sp.]|uniref:cation-translocating P-type ATPase n=1 Tax=uncultured Piscinibacter sp. TaxID=1131835 RepID=UPI0026154F35|nr:cation-translocating P-type ATPase [uncultured Piscinibacter sp.]
MHTHWHLRDARDLAREHGVDPALGLDEAEVALRAVQHGPNVIAGGARRSLLALLFEQFKDFMIVVLLAAAIISGLIGDVVDTLAIVVIVLLNGLVGFAQAWRADRALAALRQLAAARATVLRGGQRQLVPASQLVPGDIVLLEAGNQVPADLRLIEIAQLRVDESALTGESVAVDKHARTLHEAAAALGDRLNMAFKGTTAAHGRGTGLVVATGMATELGKVAGLLDRAGELKTPLQQRLAAFGKRLALVVLAICTLIFLIGVMRGEPPLLMVLTAVSLAVAAIPESLPAVVTVLLALGARRMVQHNALVRRLPSVETLGSVSTICSDKTGTLTQNRMQAEQVVAEEAAMAEALRAAALCNDAVRGADGGWQGDPTEAALAELAASQGQDRVALESASPRVAELPFDAERKRMSTLHSTDGGFVLYTKGAPESLLPRCTARWGGSGTLPIDIDALIAQAEAMAARGLRVLAFARRTLARADVQAGADALERELALIALVGLIDPPRAEAAAAVRDCLSAGITPVMITGDHPATARAIALRLGIVDDPASPVLTGTALAELDDAGLRARCADVRIYARVDPAQKIRIVEALQSLGRFVAMTGDGVNDAPALQRADIGVSMGRGGTDVAREASSLVLLDDNFATIVAAVREGRRIYDNVRKFVRYAMTGNSGEIWTLFLAPMLGLPIPLLPIHILWVNLVTDGLPGLALAAEPAERGVMKRPPRPPGESLFADGLWQHVLFIGLLIGGLCLAVQAWALSSGHMHWQTMVFTVLTFAQMAHVLAIRSESEPLWRQGLASNLPLLGAVGLTLLLQLAAIYVPWLQPIFKTEALAPAELAICFAAAGVVYLAAEAEKAWRHGRRQALEMTGKQAG